MKKSSDWVRQPGLDRKLDQLVEERGGTPAELNIYDAAKALGIEPNGEFYKKVRDWKQRRTAESEQPFMEVPAQVQAAFRDVLDRFAGDAMDNFLRAIRTIGGDLDRAAALRVADAERRGDEARAEVSDLLDHWTAAQMERDAALDRVAGIEQELAASRRREDHLQGQLGERHALLKALRLATVAVGEPPVTPDRQQDSRPSEDGGASTAQAGIPMAGEQDTATDLSAAFRAHQPGVVETSPPTGGQVETPLVTGNNADQADIADDDRV